MKTTKTADSSGMIQNSIGSGTKIKGDIETNGDIKIDGTVEGNVNSKGRVLIWNNGNIIGDVKCVNCEVYGTFNGKIEVTELLSLKESSRLSGDIKTGKLSIEPGAKFTGTCDMGGNATKAVSPDSNAKK